MRQNQRREKKYGRFVKLLLPMILFALVLVSLTERQPVAHRAIYFAHGDSTRVALTFETLWSSSDLEQLLCILEEEGVRATFFITGAWLKQNPDQARQILAYGHEIGNHTMNHKQLLSLDREEMVKEISAFNTLAVELLDYRPRLFRPPLGQYNGAVLKSARQQGCLTVLWSVESYDTISESSAEIVRRVSDRAHGGAIILFRAGAPLLPAALPEILEELRRRGYEPVTLTELPLP